MSKIVLGTPGTHSCVRMHHGASRWSTFERPKVAFKCPVCGSEAMYDEKNLGKRTIWCHGTPHIRGGWDSKR